MQGRSNKVDEATRLTRKTQVGKSRTKLEFDCSATGDKMISKNYETLK